MRLVIDKILLEPRENMYFKDCRNKVSNTAVLGELWHVFRSGGLPGQIQDIKNGMSVTDESGINSWLEYKRK